MRLSTRTLIIFFSVLLCGSISCNVLHEDTENKTEIKIPTTTDQGSVVTIGAKAKAMCEKYAAMKAETSGEEKIVGGTNAKPKEFPHMAAIGYDTDDGIDWKCGGSLISERFVLTAAHCTYSAHGGEARWARLGDIILNRTDDNASPNNYLIIERIRYNEYQSRYAYHDIALLKLEKNMKFNAWISPCCLPYSLPDIGTDGKAIATGWGRTDYLGEPSQRLLKVTLDLIPQSECNASFAHDTKFPLGIVDEWQICAGGDGKDTCMGDSGGPLVIFNPDYVGMYNVIGVTNTGRACGFSDPGVYTRVYHYISWIENIVWPDS